MSGDNNQHLDGLLAFLVYGSMIVSTTIIIYFLGKI